MYSESHMCHKDRNSKKKHRRKGICPKEPYNKSSAYFCGKLAFSEQLQKILLGEEGEELSKTRVEKKQENEK